MWLLCALLMFYPKTNIERRWEYRVKIVNNHITCTSLSRLFQFNYSIKLSNASVASLYLLLKQSARLFCFADAAPFHLPHNYTPIGCIFFFSIDQGFHFRASSSVAFLNMASLVFRSKSGNCYNILFSWPPVLGDLAETMISGGITSTIVMLSTARQRKLFRS